jgi:hypothetical protein
VRLLVISDAQQNASIKAPEGIKGSFAFKTLATSNN